MTARRVLTSLALAVNAVVVLLALAAIGDPTRNVVTGAGSALWTTFGPHFALVGLVTRAWLTRRGLGPDR